MKKKKVAVPIFYDSVADIYDNLYVDYLSIEENYIVQDWFLKEINSFDNFKMLDLGCGTGLGLEFLLNYVGQHNNINYSYTGLDVSEKMIKNCLVNFSDIKNIQFDYGDMCNLIKYSDESFDIVTSFFGSFSHVKEYDKTIKEIKRVLKPGGKLFLMTYSRFSLRNFFKVFYCASLRSLKFKQPYNIRNNKLSISCDAYFYDPKTIKNLLNKKGFVDISFKGLNYFFELPFLKRILINKQNVIRKLFQFEIKIFKKAPFFAHSLITIATKK